MSNKQILINIFSQKIANILKRHREHDSELMECLTIFESTAIPIIDQISDLNQDKNTELNELLFNLVDRFDELDQAIFSLQSTLTDENSKKVISEKINAIQFNISTLEQSKNHLITQLNDSFESSSYQPISKFDSAVDDCIYAFSGLALMGIGLAMAVLAAGFVPMEVMALGLIIAGIYVTLKAAVSTNKDPSCNQQLTSKQSAFVTQTNNLFNFYKGKTPAQQTEDAIIAGSELLPKPI